MLRFAGVMLILLLLSGCSTLKVFTDYAEDADFASFQTFQFKDSGLGLGPVNQLTHRRIVNAIRGEMIAAGFREVDTDPDLLVSYYGKIDESIVIMTSGWDYHHPVHWHNPRTSSRGWHQTTSRTSTVREGTLMIDIWEAEPKLLVWRAEISDFLSSRPDLNAETVKTGIARAFQQFPPGSN